MLQLAKLNIDDDGSILVKINGRDCGLRFNGWAYVLASKSSGQTIHELAQQLKDTSRNMEALTHIVFGASVNWCQFHFTEPWFNLSHVADFLFQDPPMTWAITAAFCDQFNRDCEGAAELFLNPN